MGQSERLEVICPATQVICPASLVICPAKSGESRMRPNRWMRFHLGLVRLPSESIISLKRLGGARARSGDRDAAPGVGTA